MGEYESDFVRLSQEVAEKLETTTRVASTNPEQHCFEKERQLAKTDLATQQIEMEARTLTTDSRSSLRQALLCDNSPSTHDVFLPGCEQVMFASNDLERSSRQLGDAHRLILESEQISLGVANDLVQQRDVILHAQGNMSKVHINMGTAKHLLDSIGRHARVTRTSVYVAVGIISLLLLVLGYLSFVAPILNLKERFLATRS